MGLEVVRDAIAVFIYRATAKEVYRDSCWGVRASIATVRHSISVIVAARIKPSAGVENAVGVFTVGVGVAILSILTLLRAAASTVFV
jgi:hypothetical protein